MSRDKGFMKYMDDLAGEIISADIETEKAVKSLDNAHSVRNRLTRFAEVVGRLESCRGCSIPYAETVENCPVGDDLLASIMANAMLGNRNGAELACRCRVNCGPGTAERMVRNLIGTFGYLMADVIRMNNICAGEGCNVLVPSDIGLCTECYLTSTGGTPDV